MTRPLLLAVSLAAALLAVTSCDSAPSRLGTSAEPVTITSIYGSGVVGIGTDVLDALVAGTADQPVEVSKPLPSSESPLSELEALDALAAGRTDLTVVRAGALAQRGASSIGVLQTPLLIVSPEHADKVAAAPLAHDLMADLDSLGLTGLALVPGGVRHPFGYRRALYGPDDYEGRLINTGATTGADPLLQTLGARPDHSSGDGRLASARAGTLAGIEASLLQPGAVDRPAIVTSNVSLYTKFDVVVIRKDAWDGLTQTQQEQLRAAAADAGLRAEAARGTEETALDYWCSLPEAASVLADPRQLAAIRGALAPAIAAATDEPSTKALADRVAALGSGTEPPRGKLCGSIESGPPLGEFLVDPVGDQSVFEGVWRIEAQVEDFLDVGVSLTEARANAGVWTVTVRGHEATVDQPNGADCAWNFRVNGDRVSVEFERYWNDACFGTALGTWRREGDTVYFSWQKERNYGVALDQAMFKGGMHRIG